MPALPLDIEKLIPHRDRMKFVNAVLEITADAVITSALVSERWPLCDGSSVDPVILVEVVAQTAGIHIGWKKRRENGEKGWLVGIKEADFFRERIPLHTELITTVKDLYSAENYNVMEGTVTAGTDLLCRIQIQVFHSESDEHPDLSS